MGNSHSGGNQGSRKGNHTSTRNSTIRSAQSGENTPRLLLLSRTVLVANILVGAMRMMAGYSFWWIVGLGYVFVVLGILEACLEPTLKRPKLLAGALVVAGIIFTVAFVLVKSPLLVAATAAEGDYADGTIVDGIKWGPSMAELRMSISNRSGEDYADMDMTFQPDDWIVKVQEVSHLGVKLLDVDPDIGKPQIRYSADGKQVDMPVPNSLINNVGFRARIDRFPRRSTIDLVIATVRPLHDTSPPGTYSLDARLKQVGPNLFRMDYGTDGGLYAPRRRIERIIYGGEYKGSNGRIFYIPQTLMRPVLLNWKKDVKSPQ